MRPRAAADWTPPERRSETREQLLGGGRATVRRTRVRRRLGAHDCGRGRRELVARRLLLPRQRATARRGLPAPLFDAQSRASSAAGRGPPRGSTPRIRRSRRSSGPRSPRLRAANGQFSRLRAMLAAEDVPLFTQLVADNFDQSSRTFVAALCECLPELLDGRGPVAIPLHARHDLLLGQQPAADQGVLAGTLRSGRPRGNRSASGAVPGRQRSDRLLRRLRVPAGVPTAPKPVPAAPKSTCADERA